VNDGASRGERDPYQRQQRRQERLEPFGHAVVMVRAYTHGVARRSLAIGLGCVTALGMQVVFELAAGLIGVSASAVSHYLAIFAALVLGGYVAGHLVGRLQALHGAFAAVLYIFVTVTVSSIREAAVARQLGINSLPPIDFVQLAITDVLAMTGASWGGWLAGRS
jgi:hypothetical protein